MKDLKKKIGKQSMLARQVADRCDYSEAMAQKVCLSLSFFIIMLALCLVKTEGLAIFFIFLLPACPFVLFLTFLFPTCLLFSNIISDCFRNKQTGRN